MFVLFLHLDMEKKDTTSWPEGLTCLGEVISVEQEDEILYHVNHHQWDTFLKRRVQHYGYRYDYRLRTIENKAKLPQAQKPEDLPVWSLDLARNLLEKKLIPKLPNQLIVNEYTKGQGISKHTDHPMFGNTIFSVSLGSPCVMVFRRGTSHVEINVAPRMFMKMEGAARSSWTHEIPPLDKGVRVSLTFRYVDEKSFPTK